MPSNVAFPSESVVLSYRSNTHDSTPFVTVTVLVWEARCTLAPPIGPPLSVWTLTERSPWTGTTFTVTLTSIVAAPSVVAAVRRSRYEPRSASAGMVAETAASADSPGARVPRSAESTESQGNVSEGSRETSTAGALPTFRIESAWLAVVSPALPSKVKISGTAASTGMRS